MGNVINIISRENNQYVKREKSGNSTNNSKEKVICKSPEIKTIIMTTVESKCWNFKEFGYILERIGLKTPVTLSDLSGSLDPYSIGTVKCTTADGKEVYISCLSIVGAYDFAVKTENTTTYYDFSSLMEGGKKKPEVYIISRETVADDGNKTIVAKYNDEIFQWILKLDKTHAFKLDAKLGIRGEDFIKAGEDAKYKKIEEYLLSLSDFSKTFEIYHELLRILELPEDYIKESLAMVLSYGEYTKNVWLARSGMAVLENKVKQYIVSKNDEIFNLYANGDREYIANGIVIKYFKDTEYTELQLSGSEENICTISPQEIFPTIKKKFSKFNDVFEEGFLDSYNTNQKK